MQIDHVAMYVKDLENTKTFFEKYFSATSNDGYHNKNTDFRSYFLSFENGSRLISQIWMTKKRVLQEQVSYILLSQ